VHPPWGAGKLVPQSVLAAVPYLHCPLPSFIFIFDISIPSNLIFTSIYIASITYFSFARQFMEEAARAVHQV
jgi:hypothetical protein